MFARSHDGSDIYYEVTGDADTALVFVHGWMGNVRWWDAQRDAFAATHRVVALDLAGHGQSSRSRTAWSAEAYGADIVAVVRAVAAPRVVLVGHSMSGAYVVAACPEVERLAGVILVDTLKDLDALPSWEHVAPRLASYRADYRKAVMEELPAYLFAPGTPPGVAQRVTGEFLGVTGDTAATLIEPLYRYDIRAACPQVRVPVRGIGSDRQAANVEANRKYLADYANVELSGCGHYPMLEVPDAFNAALRAQLSELAG
jgi:pimeloyl-ACP methyl ester carboxylesterase